MHGRTSLTFDSINIRKRRTHDIEIQRRRAFSRGQLQKAAENRQNTFIPSLTYTATTISRPHVLGAFHITVSAKLFDPIRNNTLGNILNVSALDERCAMRVVHAACEFGHFKPHSISRWLFSIALAGRLAHSSIYYLVIVSCFAGTRIFALFAQMAGTTLLRISALYRRAVDTRKWILAQCTRI